MSLDRTKQPPKPSISVIIPCYNEGTTIQEVLVALRRVPITDMEIIVVDDASTDCSTKVLQEQCASLYDELIVHPRNLGKGAALHSGFKRASRNLVMVHDADLEYNPQEIPKLVQPIAMGLADVVYGSRFRGGEARRVLFFWHSVGNKFLTTLSNAFTNLNLTDMETCYKVFKRSQLISIPLKEKRFGFEPEITAKVAKRNLRVYEVSISYSGRTYAEGKKIGWKDGFRAIYCILKYSIFN